jgi:hypothetical protein
VLNYIEINLNTYIQIWKFTEVMARDKCGLLAVLLTVCMYVLYIHVCVCVCVCVCVNIIVKFSPVCAMRA